MSGAVADYTKQTLPEKKKPAVFFAACDQENFPYAVMFWRSLTKFHKPSEIDMILYTTESRPEELKKLPKGIKIIDITEKLELDPMFWYRQKSVLSEPLLKDYELAVGFDCDQLVLGSLDYILKTKDYDVATVLNYNKPDAEAYGVIGAQGIHPAEYFNCGLVAIRSEKFAHHWTVCNFSEQFNRLQYKEQDIYNILCYYGNYNVRCLDHGDGVAGMQAWWGLFSKTYWFDAILKDGEVIVPKVEGDPLRTVDTQLTVIHWAGGKDGKKLEWHTRFNDEVSAFMDTLVQPTQ